MAAASAGRYVARQAAHRFALRSNSWARRAGDDRVRAPAGRGPGLRADANRHARRFLSRQPRSQHRLDDPAEGTWDLSLDGFTIRLNGGVSGSGAAAAAETTEDFEAIATASTDPRAYLQDNFGGVFNSHPWYRYNLTGENIIHPTFDVYLVKRGDDVYKVQLINYYGAAGEPRHITFRYARLTE
jgi:hypothetical protein